MIKRFVKKDLIDKIFTISHQWILFSLLLLFVMMNLIDLNEKKEKSFFSAENRKKRNKKSETVLFFSGSNWWFVPFEEGIDCGGLLLLVFDEFIELVLLVRDQSLEGTGDRVESVSYCLERDSDRLRDCGLLLLLSFGGSVVDDGNLLLNVGLLEHKKNIFSFISSIFSNCY